MKKVYQSPTYEVILQTEICVACGGYAGEGRQICVSCEEKLND